MILKSFDFQCDFDFQITTSKIISILILNHLYLCDLILTLKSTYDDFAHLCIQETISKSIKTQRESMINTWIKQSLIRKWYLLITHLPFFLSKDGALFTLLFKGFGVGRLWPRIYPPINCLFFSVSNLQVTQFWASGRKV